MPWFECRARSGRAARDLLGPVDWAGRVARGARLRRAGAAGAGEGQVHVVLAMSDEGRDYGGPGRWVNVLHLKLRGVGLPVKDSVLLGVRRAPRPWPPPRPAPWRVPLFP